MDFDGATDTSPPRDELWTLLGVYFNQDSPDLYGEPWDAAAAYREAAGPSRSVQAARAARALAEGADNEAEAEAAAEGLGLDYYPPADGYTYRGWLLALADFLETGRRTTP